MRAMPSWLSGKWQFLARLSPYVAEHKRRLGLGFICILLTNAFFLATPWVVKYAIDDLYVSVTSEKFAFYAAAVVVLAILEGVFRFAMRWLIIGVSRDVEYSLRNDVFAHLQTLSLSFYQRNKTGDLMSRATNDLSNVRMLLGPGIMYTANTLTTAVFAIAMMLSINWQLTLLALLPLPLADHWGVARR